MEEDEEDKEVGEDEDVDDEGLLQLEHCSSLTNEQAQKVIELWRNLSPHDTKAVAFSPRHRS